MPANPRQLIYERPDEIPSILEVVVVCAYVLVGERNVVYAGEGGLRQLSQ
jgi:hypothetical protein